MDIEEMSDDELIDLWDEIMGSMNLKTTAVQPPEVLRTMIAVQSELMRRGYKPIDGDWVKAWD